LASADVSRKSVKQKYKMSKMPPKEKKDGGKKKKNGIAIQMQNLQLRYSAATLKR